MVIASKRITLLLTVYDGKRNMRRKEKKEKARRKNHNNRDEYERAHCTCSATAPTLPIYCNIFMCLAFPNCSVNSLGHCLVWLDFAYRLTNSAVWQPNENRNNP